MIKKRLESELKHDEGLSLRMYKCSAGKWTIGYGHNMDNGIPIEVAELLFQYDVRQAIADARSIPEFWRCTGDQQEVLIHMCFNMGLPSVLTFKKMLAALSDGDGATAAKELLDSKYAREDVPKERVCRLARRLQND